MPPFIRSYLYTPGNAEAMLASALDRGADAVIADLEDAVPIQERATARALVKRWLDSNSGKSCERWVRVTPDAWREDLGAILCSSLSGIVLPKAEVSLIEAVTSSLRRWEQEFRPAGRSVRLMPLVESATALRDIDAVSSQPGVDHLGMGEVDLGAQLGLILSESETELLYARSSVVVASAAAHIGAPTGSTSTNYGDLDELARGTLGLRRLGFRSRTAIHPAQIPIINRIFSPDEFEVASAQAVISALEAAAKDGLGVARSGDGHMIDAATRRSATRMLDSSVGATLLEADPTD